MKENQKQCPRGKRLKFAKNWGLDPKPWFYVSPGAGFRRALLQLIITACGIETYIETFDTPYSGVATDNYRLRYWNCFAQKFRPRTTVATDNYRLRYWNIMANLKLTGLSGCNWQLPLAVLKRNLLPASPWRMFVATDNYRLRYWNYHLILHWYISESVATDNYRLRYWNDLRS